MKFDVAIIGAGPAGLAAAKAAARSGQRIVLIDDNPVAGGQIWRGSPKIAIPENVRFVSCAKVFDVSSRFIVHTESAGDYHAGKLILATGARELFLPFPGWTDPGMLGAGGLQALVKCGLTIRCKRVVVAGSGPLLLAVAATLRSHGARIQAVVEQAPLHRLRKFLLQYPAKLPQAISLRARLLGVPYLTGVWPTAFADGRLHLSNGKSLPAEYVACGFGLTPNTEMAQYLGCRVDDGFVAINSYQMTSVEGVYCAGEPTGIGGLEKALEEGERAGCAATGQPVSRRRSKTGAFVRDLAEAFRLNPALADIAAPDTVICRCEQVPRSALESYRAWRPAKLQTRCGMGPCQGRVCGPITAQLFGWTPGSVRPPLVPVPIGRLLECESYRDHHE